MSTKLEANFLCAYVEDGVILVGFADDEVETQNHVLLQRSLEPDAQHPDHNQVHITYGDQSRSAYGGIQKVILRNGIAEILVDSSTAMKLGTAERIEIHFQADSKEIPMVKQRLQEMFADQDGVLMIWA